MHDIFKTAKDVPLVDVIQKYAPIELKLRGGRYWGCCPFHQEQTPSFALKGQRWTCYGACGDSGDGTDFIARLYGLRPIDAAQTIARDFGLETFPGKPLTTAQRQDIRQRKKMNRVDEVFRLAVDEAYITLCDVRIECCRIIDATGVYGFRLSHVPDMIDLYLDALQFGTDTEKLEILKNGEVEKWKKLLP